MKTAQIMSLADKWKTAHVSEWDVSESVAAHKALHTAVVGLESERDYLLSALQGLVNQLHTHHKMNVRKDFSLMCADAAARTALHKALGGTL